MRRLRLDGLAGTALSKSTPGCCGVVGVRLYCEQIRRRRRSKLVRELDSMLRDTKQYLENLPSNFPILLEEIIDRVSFEVEECSEELFSGLNISRYQRGSRRC